MRFSWFLALSLVSLASAQTAPAPAAPATKVEQSQPAAAPEKTVAPEDTVLTVKGVCADPSNQLDCNTKVSRAEFERLAAAVQPNMPAAMHRRLATYYVQMLLMSSAAEKRGLDKTPKFQEILRFSRMQVLSQEFSRTLQEEAGKLTDADYEDYYKKNAANFEQADFLKIYISHNKQTAPKPGAKDADIQAQQKAGEEEMAKLAADIHARAVKGEDFAVLQKEAYAATGFKGNPPDTKLNKARRSTLPPKQAVAFDLKPGQVSELISDPAGYYIYKMIGKQPMPLDTVKDEIRGIVSAQRYRDAMQAFQKPDNADLNEAYFGSAPKPPAFPVRGAQPAAKGEKQDEDHD